ncbi:hypothetical protein O0L34_g2418 [Tuta absoluta]|nr:hypothetical protein O0L34_g2418 [Tuta absoluta]
MQHVLCFLIFILLICISVSKGQEEKELSLNELFGIEDGQSHTPSPSRKRKRTSVIDIASLTEDKLNKNFEALYKELGDPKDDKEAIKEYVMHYLNQTVSNQTRRFWLPYKPVWTKVLGLNWKNSDWWAAQKHMNYAKTTDNMLTLIYMARYKLKEIERHPMYTIKTPAFKIGNIYQKLRNLRRHIRSQWTRMENAYPFVFWDKYKYWSSYWAQFDSRWYDTNVWMANHERIVALHTQFCYYWWVLVRLHEAHCNVNHIYMTKPTAFTTTTTTTTTNAYN